MKKYAIVTDLGIFGIHGVQVKLSRPVRHAAELHLLGEKTGISSFWLMPNTGATDAGWEFVADAPGYKIFIPGDRDESSPVPSCVIRKTCQREEGEVHINYPAGSRWSWRCPNMRAVADTLKYLSDGLVGVDIAYSPQHMGKAKLRQLYAATERLQRYLARPTVDLSKLPFRKAAPEIYFTGAQEMREGDYVHFYDKNAAHPAAAGAMVTGIGTPVHVDQEQDRASWPGIYRVSFAVNGSIFDGSNLPLIIEHDQEWATADAVKFAQRQGYMVEIHESYVFEKSHRIFEGWVHDLWYVRQRLKSSALYPNEDARLNAYDTMKDIMNNSISAMSLHTNWWADMVSGARVARLANLAKWEESGHRPLYVFVDDLAFVSQDPDPATAVPDMLARRDELGGYKHKYTLKLTQEMIDQCQKYLARANQQRGASMLHSYFKGIARERGLIE